MSEPDAPIHVVETLDGLGAADLGDAAPRFVDGLDARLRVLHASTMAPFEPVVPIRRTAIGVGVLALTVIALLLLLTGPRGLGSVELLEARDVSIVLPDGTEVAARPGVQIPIGSVVSTGPDGLARFAFGTIGPDRVVVVLEDRFQTVVKDADGGEPGRRGPPQSETTSTTARLVDDADAPPPTPDSRIDETEAEDVDRSLGGARPDRPRPLADDASSGATTTTLTGAEGRAGRG